MTSAVYWIVFVFAIFTLHRATSDDDWETDWEDLTYKNHPCKRECVANETKICYYQFDVEWFYSMSKACFNCSMNETDCFRKDCIIGDGTRKPVISVNRMVPGPTIEVCLGDTVFVDLKNKMPDEACTIHWHGHHQAKRPYMDGVPYITQCPVLPLTTFRYTLDATNCGTHWWHSHVGTQKGEGVFGALIIKVPKENDAMKDYYDYDEHRLVLTDWSNQTSLNKHYTYYLGDTFDYASSILCNGLGPVWNNGTKMTTTPVLRMNVTQGCCHRFRIVHAGSRVCPMEVYIDKHNFTLIATDGENVQPIIADSLSMMNGERYDIVVCANRTEGGCYWIRVTGSVSCVNVHQVVILCYSNSTNSTPPGDVYYNNHDAYTMQINPYNMYDNASNTVSVNDFCTYNDSCIVDGDDPSLNETVPLQHIIEYDFRGVNQQSYHKDPYGYNNVSSDYQRSTPQLNNFTFKYPSSNLYSQWNDIDQSTFCSNVNVSNCNDEEVCECTHIINVPTNCCVEIVFIDRGSVPLAHPIHLHGYSFYVVACEKVIGITKDKFIELDEAGEVKRHLGKDTSCLPTRKDVIPVTSPGYTIIRFCANNPGLWFVHCHVEPHLDVGMAMVVKVGEYEEWVKPPSDFPSCGNFNTTS